VGYHAPHEDRRSHGVVSDRMSKARLLTQTEIHNLNDRQLVAWYRELKLVRQLSRDGEYENPKQIRWCYYEARRELTRRGVRKYKDTPPLNAKI